jgi:hypothetical protein
MKDTKFQEIIDKTLRAKQRYFSLLQKVEDEYKKRFGFDPSDIDDDFFIDTFHCKQGYIMTVKEMTKEADRISK